MQSYYDLLTLDEREILRKLDYYCFDQAGCRMLQQMIQDQVTEGSSTQKPHSQKTLQQPKSLQRRAFTKCLIHYVRPIITDVMVNQFGNYLCQRIMEEADSYDMEKIVETIQYDLVNVSLNIHGTRVIQILIERLSN